MVTPHSNGHHGGTQETSSGFGSDEHCKPAQGPHPLEPLLVHLAQLRRHANDYLAATADSLRLTLRQLALYAALGCVGAIVGIALLATAAVFVLSGAAGGLGEAFGGRLWAGQLTVGIGLLLLVGIGSWWFVRRATESSRRKTLQKYERRHHEDQAHEHATDASQSARS